VSTSDGSANYNNVVRQADTPCPSNKFGKSVSFGAREH